MNKEKIFKIKIQCRDEERWIELPFEGEINKECKIVDCKTKLFIKKEMVYCSELYELNTLAFLVKRIGEIKLKKLNMILSSNKFSKTVTDVITLIDIIDDFVVMDNVSSYSDLGKKYVKSNNGLTYEEIGRIIVESQDGIFLSNNKYLYCLNKNYLEQFKYL